MFFCSYEHVVYILDSLIYTLTKWPKIATDALTNADSATTTTSSLNNETAAREDKNTGSLNFELGTKEAKKASKMDTDHSQTSTKRLEIQSRFFSRTESVIASSENELETQKSNSQFFSTTSTSSLPLESSVFFGPSKVWGSQNFSQPLEEAYPLAQQPHLLKPYAKKQHLFSGCHERSKDDGSRDEKEPEHRLDYLKYLCTIIHACINIPNMVSKINDSLSFLIGRPACSYVYKKKIGSLGTFGVRKQGIAFCKVLVQVHL